MANYKPSGRSMFGSQHDSRKTTAPNFGFGSSGRSHYEHVYLSAEHSKNSYGKSSPGPVYDLKSTLGKQENSRNPSAPLFSFGTADRFAKATRPGASTTSVPGPGAYAAPSAIGRQSDSVKQTAPQYGLGTSTRDGSSKVFLSAEQAKINFGVSSPGPAQYKSVDSIGMQPKSNNETAPQWKLGTEERFNYGYVTVAAQKPGAGQYSHTSSVGNQADSRKKSAANYGFGTSTRDKRGKLYVSPEHEKSQYGVNTPGPNYNLKSSLGDQVNSKKNTSFSYSFGHAQRLTQKVNLNPGPGQYD